MNKVVPHQKYYDRLKYPDKICTWSIWLSTFIAVILLALEIFDQKLPNLANCLNTSLAFLSVVYFISDVCQTLIFHKAETVRNLDFIDNGLGTRFAEKNSSQYYSNDEIEKGIVKLGVNGFENSFFTMNVTSIMFRRGLIKILTVVLVILVVILTSSHIVTVILQLALPYSIILQTIKMYNYNNRVTQIFHDYKSTFNHAKEDYIIPCVIKNLINYEKIISWAGIPLDSKIFNNNNERLSIEWEEVKKSHISETE